MELPPTPHHEPQAHPLGYLTPLSQSLPRSIPVLSAIATTFGIFGSVGAFVAIRELLKPVTLRPEVEGVRTFIELNVIVTAVLFVALFIGGVGGLARRSWARRWLVNWSIVDLCWTVVRCEGRSWITFVDHERVLELRNLLEQAGVNTKAMTTANLIGIDIALIVLISVASSILPICIVTFWRRPNVVRAFKEAGNYAPSAMR